MNVLVTGSTGFIGTALVKALINEKYNVYCLIRNKSIINTNKENIIRLKDNSIESFKLALQSRKFDFIINLASYGVRRGDSDLNTMIDGNVNFLANLICSLTEKPKMIINVGSCSEYGFIGEGKYVDESTPLAPVTLYGAAKSATTLFGNTLAILHDVKLISLRLFGVYGEGEADYRLLPYLVNNLNNNESVELTSGEQQRDVLYIDDIVNAFLCAINKYENIPSNSSYNVCSGVPVRVKDFVEYIALKMNKSVDLLKWGVIDRPDEPEWLVCSNELFKRYTDWEPQFDMKSGLDKAVISILKDPQD